VVVFRPFSSVERGFSVEDAMASAWLPASAGHVRQVMMDKRISCRVYTRETGEDAPEIRDWKWTAQ
jgi:phosphoketolase